MYVEKVAEKLATDFESVIKDTNDNWQEKNEATLVFKFMSKLKHENSECSMWKDYDLTLEKNFGKLSCGLNEEIEINADIFLKEYYQTAIEVKFKNKYSINELFFGASSGSGINLLDLDKFSYENLCKFLGINRCQKGNITDGFVYDVFRIKCLIQNEKINEGYVVGVWICSEGNAEDISKLENLLSVNKNWQNVASQIAEYIKCWLRINGYCFDIVIKSNISNKNNKCYGNNEIKYFIIVADLKKKN